MMEHYKFTLQEPKDPNRLQNQRVFVHKARFMNICSVMVGEENKKLEFPGHSHDLGLDCTSLGGTGTPNTLRTFSPDISI